LLYRSALIVGFIAALCTMTPARGGGFGVCEGEGCTEPCPAEGACLRDADCAEGMTCRPACAPSICYCDPIRDTWGGGTRDCNGICAPAPIPTVSGWGVIIMMLLLLTAEKICMRRTYQGPRTTGSVSVPAVGRAREDKRGRAGR
jgi:hypothetical protein